MEPADVAPDGSPFVSAKNKKKTKEKKIPEEEEEEEDLVSSCRLGHHGPLGAELVGNFLPSTSRWNDFRRSDWTLPHSLPATEMTSSLACKNFPPKRLIP